jgi:hypothetical protein
MRRTAWSFPQNRRRRPNMNRCAAIAAMSLALGACSTGAPREDKPAATPGHDAAAWSQLDGNHDGYLDRAELGPQHAVGLLQDFHAADVDGDGRIARNEWSAWWPRLVKAPPAPGMAELNATSEQTGAD